MADISQRVVFTIIPDGFRANRARLNLHIAPRLSLTAGVIPNTLTQFPAWRDWADTINAAEITLRINGAAFPVDRLSEADPAIWTALFPPSTRVQTHAFQDLRESDILTYPLAELAVSIENDYVGMAGQGGEELPRVRDLEKWIRYQPTRRLDRKALIKLLRDSDGVQAVSDREIAIALLAEYHRPLNAEKIMTAEKQGPDDPHENADYRAHERMPMPTVAQLAEQFDFHRIVAAIGQHPALMRACGLVVPLEAKLADIPPGNCALRVAVDWNTQDVETEADICPTTQARRDANDFRARPHDPSALAGGWLRLDPAKYSLVAMDVDGAGLSLKNFSFNLPRIGEERYDDESFSNDRVPRAGTPRLRTAGIQLAHSRRDRAIRKLFEGSGTLNDAASSNNDLELFAEDLIRGWRADVEDDVSQRWQSLLRFDGSYTLINIGRTIQTEDEETPLKLVAGKAADGTDPDLLKASEAVFAWSGWSLAAPQPGLAVMPDDVTHAEAPNEVPDGLPLQTSARARAGSLPLLRFGRRYRVRMRYADLAGGGLGWTPEDIAPSAANSRPYAFGRYEPAEAPTLTLIDGAPLPKDGESMARGALRTMDDAVANDIAVRRNIVPPRVGIRFAELHGVLDKGRRPDPDVYALLTDRDANYPEVVITTNAFNPADPAEEGAVVETAFATAPAAEGTPYLYDPQTAGCALRIAGVPGVDPNKIWTVPFVGDSWDADAPLRWPNARGFSLLASENGTTGWDAVKRVFRVALKEGERARIRVSALVPKRALLNFKLLDRLRELAEAGVDPEAQARYFDVRGEVMRGQHWMFTPWRVVELVHALQRPLVEPAYLNLNAGRSRGNVTASIHYATPVHCKSTVRIDTAGGWMEIDDRGPAGPTIRQLEADAFSRPFARLDQPEGIAWRLFGSHVFDDTRARFVTYQMRATTRFREFMPPAIRADAGALIRQSEPRSIWVPSSSPPTAPVVRYVVPTFGWFESGAPGEVQRSWRDGGGLRVYLDRPWFSSGSNEMLAVLLGAGATDPGDGPLKDYVTQWGRDPAWAGPKVTTIAPQRNDFPRRINAGPVPYDFGDPDNPVTIPDGEEAGNAFRLTNLTPQGAPGDVLVHAVPHAVGYDPARKLWYADIIIRPGDAYYPFVRMALARYQPHAIMGCELSSAVIASFQQLSPDRVATVTPVPLFLDRGRRVAVYGRLPTGGTVLPSAGNIDVRLQRLSPGGDPDLDWRDTPQGQMPQPPPPGALGLTQIRRTNSAFNLARDSLSRTQRALVREAAGLVDAGRIAEVLEQPGLLDLLLPPLIYEETMLLPPAGDDRLRLLVTETEIYDTEADDNRSSAEPRQRIVYAATIDL